jgi:hypothetical protein
VFYSSPQARVLFIATGQGGEREAAGRREREAAGRREAGSREGRRERAERSWGSAGRARSEAARGAARPGKEAARAVRPACARARPARRSAAAAAAAAASASPRSGPWPGAHCRRLREAGLWTRTATGPRPCSGRARSCAPGALGDPRIGTSARARAPAQAAPGWAVRGARLGTVGRLQILFLPVSGALWSALPVCGCLGAAVSGSSSRLGPGGWSHGAAAASCRARGGRASGGLQEDPWGQGITSGIREAGTGGATLWNPSPGRGENS